MAEHALEALRRRFAAVSEYSRKGHPRRDGTTLRMQLDTRRFSPPADSPAWLMALVRQQLVAVWRSDWHAEPTFDLPAEPQTLREIGLERLAFRGLHSATIGLMDALCAWATAGGAHETLPAVERCWRNMVRVEHAVLLCHRPLAIALARRIALRSGGELDDRQQDFMLALLHALHRFDPGRGLRFSTFATKTVLCCHAQRRRGRIRCQALGDVGAERLRAAAVPDTLALAELHDRLHSNLLLPKEKAVVAATLLGRGGQRRLMAAWGCSAQYVSNLWCAALHKLRAALQA